MPCKIRGNPGLFDSLICRSTLEYFKRCSSDSKIKQGRLNDYLSELDVRESFTGIKTLILDEADRMLDQGK